MVIWEKNSCWGALDQCLRGAALPTRGTLLACGPDPYAPTLRGAACPRTEGALGWELGDLGSSLGFATCWLGVPGQVMSPLWP